MMNTTRAWKFWLGWCWLLARPTDGLSISQDSVVRVQKVETDDDWNALADIRFNEWIQEEHGGMTSRNAFRSATRDIYKEERPRSLLFLAKRKGHLDTDDEKENNQQEVVVGAAELSPYEVEMALCTGSVFSALYVTDVVTDSKFRRQGIARAMMEEIEEHAAAADANADANANSNTNTNTNANSNMVRGKVTHLVLNVAPDNVRAIQFYGSLGYRVPSSELLGFLNGHVLAEAAGTIGQILLQKKIANTRSSSRIR